MRADVVGLGLAITLLSTSLARGQVIIDVSKVTCDQFAQSKIGEPRTTAVWLNGYYHGKNGSTTIDTQRSEAIFGLLMDYCRTGENGKLLVMQVLAPDETQMTSCRRPLLQHSTSLPDRQPRPPSPLDKALKYALSLARLLPANSISLTRCPSLLHFSTL